LDATSQRAIQVGTRRKPPFSLDKRGKEDRQLAGENPPGRVQSGPFNERSEKGSLPAGERGPFARGSPKLASVSPLGPPRGDAAPVRKESPVGTRIPLFLGKGKRVLRGDIFRERLLFEKTWGRGDLFQKTLRKKRASFFQRLEIEEEPMDLSLAGGGKETRSRSACRQKRRRKVFLAGGFWGGESVKLSGKSGGGRGTCKISWLQHFGGEEKASPLKI